MKSLTERLNKLYGSDKALNIKQSKEGAILPNGNSAVVCTNIAFYIAEKEHGEVMGFSSEENPTSIISPYYDGHDFALIDKRYIVDPWVKDTEDYSKKAVFDLQNPSDKSEIKKIYGDKSSWKLFKSFKKHVTKNKPKTFNTGFSIS